MIVRYNVSCRGLGIGRTETWETLNPYGLIDELIRANISYVPEIELKKFFKKVGLIAFGLLFIKSRAIFQD